MNVKRLMAMLLTVAMIATFASFPAFADDNGAVAKKVVLTANNIIIERYFVADDWRGEDANFSTNKDLIVDGDYTTYANSDQYKEPAAEIPFNSETIVDLGVEKNLTKIDIYAGAQNGGSDGWSYAAPVNPEILVAGEDGVYRSVYTHEGTGDELYRVDSVELDPTTDGANVRYVKYLFTKIFRSPSITEIEITEMAVLEPTSYTVNYIDNNGDPVMDSKVVEGVYVNDFVTENAPVVYGYDNVEIEASLILAQDPAENVITFNYIRKTETSYTVNYVDENGNPLADPKVVDTNAFAGEEVTEYAIAISGYAVDGTSSVKKVLVEDANENAITFVYKVYNSVSGPHSDLTHLTGEALLEVSVPLNEAVSNADRLFDGDASASHADVEPAQEPDGNGIFGDDSGWLNNGDVAYVVVDLGDIYELSQINTYWGWAPQLRPTWNNWQYDVPSSYKVYIATTLEEIDAVAPAAVVSGLEKNPETFIANSYASVSTWGRYVKIETVSGGGQFALRELGFVGAEFIDPYNNTTVTVEYRDEEGNEIAPAVDVTKTTDKVAAIEPVEVIGFKPVDGAVEVTFDTDKTVVIVYKAIPSIAEAPAEEGPSSLDATSAIFDYLVTTPTNESPADVFAAENWVVDNCEITDVKVESAGMIGSVYAWNLTVTVALTNNETFSLELDLPETFEQTDVISITRTPSATSFDSYIVEGANIVEVSKTDTLIEGTVNVKIHLQSINESRLPYMGYNDVVVELKDITSSGRGFAYKASDFVRVGDTYYGGLTALEYGVERLNVVLALYGIAADGSKVELSTLTVTSEPMYVNPPEPTPDPTLAESIKDKLLPIDVIPQLIDGTVNPYALPAIGDSEWALYEEVVALREDGTDIAALKAEYEAYLASEPAGDYTDDVVLDVKKKDQASVYLWHYIKDMRVNSITFSNLNIVGVYDKGIEGAGDIVNVELTIRNGVDYDKLNFVEGGDFNLKVKLDLAASGGLTADTIGKAYNAVRRALNDDQLMPLFFRLDWYVFTPLPFKTAQFKVTVSDNWIDNNGIFNLVAYHFKGYDYNKDNTPTVTKVAEDLKITPITNEITFAVDGGSRGAMLYDTYAIISTNKLPSELPETIG